MSAEFRRCGNTNLKKPNFAVQLGVTTIRIRIEDANFFKGRVVKSTD